MSKYSETLVNEARDLLEECVNPPLAKYTLEERNELISSYKTPFKVNQQVKYFQDSLEKIMFMMKKPKREVLRSKL